MIVTKLESSRQILVKFHGIKFHENLSSGIQHLPCGWTFRQTEMKLIVAFRSFANTPRSWLENIRRYCVEYKDFWPGGPEFCPVLFKAWYVSLPRMSCALTCTVFKLSINSVLIVITFSLSFFLVLALYVLVTNYKVLLYFGKKTAWSLPNICCCNCGTGFPRPARPNCLAKSGNLYKMHYEVLTCTQTFILVTSSCKHWYRSSAHL